MAGTKARGPSVLLFMLLTAVGFCIHSSVLSSQNVASKTTCPEVAQDREPYSAAAFAANCSCPQQHGDQPPESRETVVIKEPCPEGQRVKYEPWYAAGKTWHYPAEFPLCSMDACFNFSRCETQDELLVFSYTQPSPPVRYFSSINTTVHHTDDPASACLFFVFLDTDTPWPPHPAELPHWNGGLNHVLITFADMWKQKGPLPGTIGFASIMATDMHETTYRAGFDISIPLPGNLHIPELQQLRPFERKYLMTFRGLRYLGHKGEGILRSEPAFR